LLAPLLAFYCVLFRNASTIKLMLIFLGVTILCNICVPIYYRMWYSHLFPYSDILGFLNFAWFTETQLNKDSCNLQGSLTISQSIGQSINQSINQLITIHLQHSQTNDQLINQSANSLFSPYFLQDSQTGRLSVQYRKWFQQLQRPPEPMHYTPGKLVIQLDKIILVLKANVWYLYHMPISNLFYLI